MLETYKTTSHNYRHLFDAETGYMRARDSQGNFRPDFSPYSWGRDLPNALPSKRNFRRPPRYPKLDPAYGWKEAFSNYL